MSQNARNRRLREFQITNFPGGGGGWGGEKQALDILIKATWASTCFATSHLFNNLLSSYYTSTSFSNDDLRFLYRNQCHRRSLHQMAGKYKSSRLILKYDWLKAQHSSKRGWPSLIGFEAFTLNFTHLESDYSLFQAFS